MIVPSTMGYSNTEHGLKALYTPVHAIVKSAPINKTEAEKADQPNPQEPILP
jgi:hypothetical protein